MMNRMRVQHVVRVIVSVITIFSMLVTPALRAWDVSAQDSTYQVFASGLYGPLGMAFDSAGNLYVAQSQGNNGPSVARITPSDVKETLVAGRYATSSVAFNTSGALYLSSGNGEVTRVNGDYLDTIISRGVIGYSGIIAFDQANNLYVLSSGGYLSKFSAEGALITDRLVDGPPPLKGIAIDKAAQVAYLSDWNSNITRLDLGTGASEAWLTINEATDGTYGGLAVDANGDLYEALSGTRRVVKIDHLTKAVSTCVDNLNTAGELAFDASGSLYITEYNLGLIWKVDGCGVTLPTQTPVPNPVVFPYISAERYPSSSWISFNGFTPGGQVNLTISNPDNSPAYTQTYTAPPDNGPFSINFQAWEGAFQLGNGMTVQAEDVATGIIKRVHMAPFTIDGVDYAARRIWGTGPANTWLHVQLNAPASLQEFDVKSNSSGVWNLNLPAGAELTAGMHTIFASLRDLDADWISAGNSSPQIVLSLTNDTIQLLNFPVGDLIQLTIQSADQQTLFTGTYPATVDGNIFIQPYMHSLDLSAGMTVTAVGNAAQRSVTLPNLSLRSVNTETNIVSGTADPGLQFVLQVNGMGYYNRLLVTAGQDGAWSVDTTLYNTDILDGGNAEVDYFDADGDDVESTLPAPPTIQASLTSDSLYGSNFSHNGSVNVSLYDAQNTPIYGPTVFPVDLWGNLNVSSDTTQINLLPGMRVTVEDPALELTKEFTLENLTVDAIDADNDTVSGTAPANRAVSINGGNRFENRGMGTTADANGNWLADFKTIGFDLTPDMWFNAQIWDADGDSVHAANVEPLHLETSYKEGWIHLHNASPFGTARLVVGGQTFEKQVPSYGSAEFSPEELKLALTPGMSIEGVDVMSGETVQMTIANISIDSVDYGSSLISGTASAGANVLVEMGGTPGSYGSSRMNVTAGADGHWQADLTQIGVHLTYDMWYNAQVFDESGDVTFAEPPALAQIEASPVFDYINLRGFPANSQATVSISLPSGGTPLFQQVVNINQWGDAWINSDRTKVDLIPTLQIHVTAPGVDKELWLPNISQGTVDYDADTVSGTAGPNMPLLVSFYNGPGGRMWAQADATGNWTADFKTNNVNIVPDMQPTIRFYDADGDSVYIERPNYPHLDMWLDSNSVSGYDWPLDATLTLTIHDPQANTDYTAQGVNGRAPWSPGTGFYSFNLGSAYTLKPGQQVSISDGTITRTSSVANFQAPEIDQQNSSLSGTAAPGATIWSDVCNRDGCANRRTIVGSDGTYQLDYALPGPNQGEEQTIHLYPGDNASINWADGDGNNTSRQWRIWNPNITSNLLDRWVQGRDWPKGTELTLKINGQTFGTAVMAQAPWNPNDPNDIVASFNLPKPLKPGDVLVLSDAGGFSTKTLVVSSLQVTTVNTQDRILSGTTTPNAWLQACVNVENGCIMRYVQADADGIWTANFAVEDANNQGNGTIDQLTPGMNGWVGDWDEDSDQNQVNWHVWNPQIILDAKEGWINGRDWPHGTLITLEINGVEAGTAPMAQAPWNPNDPNDYLADFSPVSFKVGDTIVLSNPDHSMTKTLVVAPLEITDVSLANSTVSGTTAPEGWLRVCANVPNADCIIRDTQADAAGHWTASFATAKPGDNDKRTLTFQAGIDGWASVRDADGDDTNRSWGIPRPFVMASVTGQYVQSRNWPLGATLNLKINGEPAGSAVVAQAPWNPDNPTDILAIFNNAPIKVGDTVTVSNADESLSGSLTIAPFEITNVNQTDATISGVASPDTWVQVCINTPSDCIMRNVLADMNGMWTANFADPGTQNGDSGQAATLVAGMNGWAAVSEADGDQTWEDWSIANPHLDVSLYGYAVSAFDWPIGASLTLTISGGSGQLYTDTQVNGAAPWNAKQGFFYFNLPGTFSLTPGQQVTITDGVTSKTTTIKTLGVPVVDLAHSRVTGTAQAGAHVWSCIDTHGNCILRTTTAGANGAYVLDWSVPGSGADEQEIHTFHMGEFGGVNLDDELGNNTFAAWNVPSYDVHATPHDQEVHGHNWPIGDVVTLTLDDPDTQAHQTATQTVVDDPTQCGAPCFQMSNLGWTLKPGQTISLSDGTVTKTVTVSPLNITLLDALHDRLAGVAGANSSIVVNIFSQGGISRHTQADAQGNWSVDFSVPGTLDYEQDLADLSADDNGRVLELNPGDNPNDGTLQYWNGSAPVALSTSNVDENAAAGSAVAQFSPVYPQVPQTLAYALVSGDGDSDNGAFTLDGATLRINASPDYETKASYSIRVRVTDSSAPGKAFEQAYLIQINNLNETPSSLTLSASSITENAAPNSTIGTFTAADPDAGQTFTYTLVSGTGDTNNTDFALSGSTLRLGSSPNFETQPSYSIRVRVTDSGSPAQWLEKIFVITVNNVIEPPSSLILSTPQVNENVAAGSLVSMLVGTLQENAETPVYSLVPGSGSTDNAAFSISGSSLTINASPNYEVKSSYSIRVRVANQGHPEQYLEQPFTIPVNNLNEAPATLSLSPKAIDEQVPANSLVGLFATTDPDTGQTFTYSLVAGTGSTDNGAFTIAGNRLTINVSPDFETKPSYSILVRVSDNGSPVLSLDQAFTITINNINENATDIQLTGTVINENVAAGSTVGTLSATGAGTGQSFNYSLVTGTGSTDNSAFSITGSSLALKASPNFEAKPSYSIRVRATDSQNATLFVDKIFTITVVDLNEAPTGMALSASSINENAAAGSTLGTLSATDPDQNQTFSYSLVTGDGSTDNGAFSISGSALSINASPDFETKAAYSIRVRVTDSGAPALFFERTFSITVNNLNEAPTALNISATSLNENLSAGSTVATFSTTDPDAGQTFSYVLVAGVGDNSAFTLTGSSLTIKASPNFEAKPSYSIRVQVTDSGSPAQSITRDFTLAVNDLNETPTDIAISASSINENAPAGSQVGTFSTTDPDQGQSFSYSLVSGTGSTDNAAFSISGNALSINAVPDREVKASYSIRVRSTDSGMGGLWVEKVLTISITDVNDAPTALNLSSTSISENVAANASVATFSTVDADLPAQTFTYSLVSGMGSTDNAAFSISGSALTINASPDFETKSSYSIRVRVTDSGAPALSFEKEFTISITDANDRPTDLSISAAVIEENSAPNTAIDTFSAVDPDLPAQTFTYSLVYGSGSADNAAFTIDGSTLRIKASPDYETKSSYSIRVRVSDSGTPSQYLDKVFTVSVTNRVDEPPMVTSFNKSGLQGSDIAFSAANFSDHFINVEASGSAFTQIKITALPEHGTLRVGSGENLALDSEIPAASLNQLIYTPAVDYSGSDVFSWNGANSAGYATSSAQVFLNIGFVPKYSLQVSPAGDAKSAKVGSSAVYTLSLTNTGNIADSYTVALANTPLWTTTFTPAQVNSLAAGTQAAISVSVAVPANASGGDEAILKITSRSDATKTVSISLKTTAITAPVIPIPLLLSVSPNSANASALTNVSLTLSGLNFSDPMTVKVGGVISTKVTRKSSAELLALLPATLKPGSYAVQVCNATAKCATLPDAFVVLDNTPIISGVYPNQGYNDASNTILVQGYNLSASTSLTLLGAETGTQPTNVNLVSGQLQATIPAGLLAGTYDLQACNSSLCSTLVSGYTALDVIKNDFSAASEDLWTSPATVREGNTINLGLNVHRASGMGLSSAQVAFYLDDPAVPANKIGSTVATSMMAPGSVEAVSTNWTPTKTGVVKLYAVIDPDGLLTEASKANNIVSTTITVLPREQSDEIAPVISSLMINSGAESTAEKNVSIALQAADNTGGSGLKTMNLVERIYNTSARQWVAVQETGWITYSASHAMTLTSQAGIHYVQAWVADGAGNTSEIAQARINYEPPQDTISEGQVRVYRLELTAGQQQHILMQTLAGDADLYIWDPDGNPVGFSNASDLAADRVDFVSAVSGTYQVEVYGYLGSTYTIDFQAQALPLAALRAYGLELFGEEEKPARFLPTIMTQNEPLNNIPTGSAPITTVDKYMVYMPFVTKQ